MFKLGVLNKLKIVIVVVKKEQILLN